MGELVFVGLGLYDEKGVSLRGLEEARTSDYVFAEFYTSLMTGLSLERLERMLGKEVLVVSRKTLEDDNGEIILQKAEKLKVVFLVPGDPLIATTHVDLRIRAEKRGIKTRIVHGASLVSAAMGLSGLQNYRFGRSVTVPFSEPGGVYETPYNVVAENKSRDLHTLCFLDIRVEEERFMTAQEALRILLLLEEKNKMHAVTLDSLAVGIARAGAENAVVKADSVKSLLNYDFGSPPHTLVFPAERLHFVEADALVKLAGAPERVKKMAR
ncbi:MAG: diphthine synthase [Candidatus Bathyarchaeia archaeon]